LNHDFGVIYKEDGNVTHVFTFKNEGMDAVTLVAVKPGCGCTASDWTKAPIEPGQTGFVSATYRAASQKAPQHFSKTVSVTAESVNSKEQKKYTLRFHGELKEKPVSPEVAFGIHVGAIGLKNKSLDFGSVRKGDVRVDGLEFANISQEEHKVEIFLGAAESFLTCEAPATIKPSEIGKFVFSFNSKADKMYGPQDIKVYLIIDGKKELTDEYALTLNANIYQDFSTLTVEEKQNSPIMEVEDVLDLGTVAAGKTLKHNLAVKNTGVNPLEILRVYSNSKDVVLKAPKAVKSGKKGTIGIEINTKNFEPGVYTRDLNIICNDFQHSVKRVKISWTVE
jgi:hypothetical protein